MHQFILLFIVVTALVNGAHDQRPTESDHPAAGNDHQFCSKSQDGHPSCENQVREEVPGHRGTHTDSLDMWTIAEERERSILPYCSSTSTECASQSAYVSVVGSQTAEKIFHFFFLTRFFSNNNKKQHDSEPHSLSLLFSLFLLLHQGKGYIALQPVFLFHKCICASTRKTWRRESTIRLRHVDKIFYTADHVLRSANRFCYYYSRFSSNRRYQILVDSTWLMLMNAHSS